MISSTLALNGFSFKVFLNSKSSSEDVVVLDFAKISDFGNILGEPSIRLENQANEFGLCVLEFMDVHGMLEVLRVEVSTRLDG